MHGVQVVLPSQLALLLSLDSQKLELVHFLLLLRDVVPALLLEFCQLNTDLVPGADLCLIKHVECHVN